MEHFYAIQMQKGEKMNVYLPPEVAKKVREDAKKQSRSVSNLLRLIIAKYYA